MEGVLTGEATSSKVIQDHHHLSSKLQQSCPNWSPWINLSFPFKIIQSDYCFFFFFFWLKSSPCFIPNHSTFRKKNSNSFPLPKQFCMFWLLTTNYSISPGFSPMPKYSGPLAVHQTCQLSIHFKIFALNVSFIWDGLPPDICITGSQT